MQDFTNAPSDLPVPHDDGGADHLLSMRLPALGLVSTQGGVVDVSALSGYVVIYCYPMTGVPGVALPPGWDQIPGARGCTPQNLAYRDHHTELTELCATVFGLSTQSTAYQQEMSERLHLPFAVLSDADMAFAKAMNLPTFHTSGMHLLKRLTLICKDQHVVAVKYPVFPSNSDAAWAVNCLRAMAQSQPD